MKVYSYISPNPIMPITDEERFIAEVPKGESISLNVSSGGGLSLRSDDKIINDNIVVLISNNENGITANIDSYGKNGDKFGSFNINSESGDITIGYMKELLESYMIEIVI